MNAQTAQWQVPGAEAKNRQLGLYKTRLTQLDITGDIGWRNAPAEANLSI